MDFDSKEQIYEYLEMCLVKCELGELTATKLNAIVKACEVLLKSFDNTSWGF